MEQIAILNLIVCSTIRMIMSCTLVIYATEVRIILLLLYLLIEFRADNLNPIG